MKKRKRKKKQNRRSDLDLIVLMCVVAGLVMTCGPLLIWCFRFDTIPDSYFEYGFHFWGSELIATVAVYWLKSRKKQNTETPTPGSSDEDTGAAG